jgi:hypothetical protein
LALLHSRTQKICAISGYVCIVLFGLAFWPTSKFIPVPGPGLNALQVASLYQNNANGIRFGMLIMTIAGSLVAPFVAVISVQMKRIEGVSPILTYTQLASGSVGALFFIIPALVFGAAAYRPDRAPELTLLLNDLAWFFMVMPVGPAIVQNLAIAFAILGDKRKHPVFPRWLGFFNIWVGLFILPGGLMTFFKSGAFAWNGLLSFYVAGTVFGVWFQVMVFQLFKAINSQAAEAA